MTHIDSFLCICDEEMCYCSEYVPVNGQPCDQCARGWHVLFPGMPSDRIRRPNRIVVSGDPFPSPEPEPKTWSPWVLVLAVILFVALVFVFTYWAAG
jgi:hypothetical protein